MVADEGFVFIERFPSTVSTQHFLAALKQSRVCVEQQSKQSKCNLLCLDHVIEDLHIQVTLFMH